MVQISNLYIIYPNNNVILATRYCIVYILTPSYSLPYNDRKHNVYFVIAIEQLYNTNKRP